MEARRLLSAYNVTAMTFPGGYMITAAAINGLGQVAGRGSYPANNAVVWQNGSIVNLDPQQIHGALSYALGLTNLPAGHEADVQVVGVTASTATTNGDVFLWVGGTMYDTSIPYSDPGYGAAALAISNSGVVAGGFQPGTDRSQAHAFVWNDTVVHNHTLDPGELQDLNSLFPGATSSVAEDVIDANGPGDHMKVVADAYVPVKGGGQQWHAYLLTDLNDDGVFEPNSPTLTEVTDLGALSQGALTQAYAVNDVGQVAGISGGSVFRWQNGVMTNIGQLGRYPTGPNAINHSGQMVGTAAGPSGPATRAWIWTGSGSITDLNGLIPKKTGWSIQDAYGINDAGQIVGAGQYPPLSNDQVAFLLTPASSTPAATISAPRLGDARLPSPPTGEAAPQPPFSILEPLTPSTGQDRTALATEVIHAGTKRPRALFWG